MAAIVVLFRPISDTEEPKGSFDFHKHAQLSHGYENCIIVHIFTEVRISKYEKWLIS